MQPQDEHLTEVVEAILRYLNNHPDAADTVEGIAKWWLPATWCIDPHTVAAALARLHAQGLVRRRRNADRHELYSRRAARADRVAPDPPAPRQGRVRVIKHP